MPRSQGKRSSQRWRACPRSRASSVEQVANVNSRDMTPAIWLDLAARANTLLAESDVAGIVVTHGTDTLEETAYFLDLTRGGDKPIVVVGAQRAPTNSDTDGPRNMLNAVRVVVSEEAVGMGTMVVMNGQINAAREVTKTNTLDVETFQTLDFGLLGVADVEVGPLLSSTCAAADDRPAV